MPPTLFRPVGLHELALIWDLGMRGFPPRLPHQPIFYPVINADYARQIARDWNTRDANSGFAGFVTEFAVDNVGGRRNTRNTGFHRKNSVHSTKRQDSRARGILCRKLHRARAGCPLFKGKRRHFPNYRHWQKLGTTTLSTWRARFRPTESPFS